MDPLNENKTKKLRNFESEDEKNLRSFSCVKKMELYPYLYTMVKKNTIIKNFNG